MSDVLHISGDMYNRRSRRFSIKVVRRVWAFLPVTFEALTEAVRIAGGTGFTLFLLLVSFLLTTFLLLVPTIYDRYVNALIHITRADLILEQVGSTETTCAVLEAYQIDFHIACFWDGSDSPCRFHHYYQRWVGWLFYSSRSGRYHLGMKALMRVRLLSVDRERLQEHG